MRWPPGMPASVRCATLQPCPGFSGDGRRVSSCGGCRFAPAPASARTSMRQILTSLAFAALLVLTASSAVAQSQPDPGKKDVPATPAVPPAPPPAADKTIQPPATASDERRKRRAGKAKSRRHAHATRRHRIARQHRRGWRNVWIYRAHDRHGHRHYEYVRRKFGGYFASARDCGCRRGVHRQHHRWHM